MLIAIIGAVSVLNSLGPVLTILYPVSIAICFSSTVKPPSGPTTIVVLEIFFELNPLSPVVSKKYDPGLLYSFKSSSLKGIGLIIAGNFTRPDCSAALIIIFFQYYL